MFIELKGIIADHLTTKFDEGGVAYTLSSRDYKGVMAVVLSESKDDVQSNQPKRSVQEG